VEHAVPVLLSRDLHETLRFYERLGFESRGAAPDRWGYIILSRGDVWLHVTLDPDVDPFTTASSCYLYVDDADALHAAWEAVVTPDPTTGSRIVAPETTDYGMREFAVVDPSGNLLRVGTRLRT
jgi:catechol 2,3-dioxygenase-like lactoylglutathione lyase family enzyme